MKPRLLALLLLTGLFITPLAGCAEPAFDPVEPEPDDGSAYPGRYRVSGAVLENAEHGPQLCRSVGDSLPPQCTGLDIVGWSWDGLDHEESGGVRWGHFEIVATFDGVRLTLAEPPQPPTVQRPDPEPNLTTPCPPPPGGWRVVDEAKATTAAYKEAFELAYAAPDAAGAWIDQNGGMNDPRKLVVNARFTGDLAAHEARLRAVWGGALCVSRAARSTAELNRVAAELSGEPGVLSAGADIRTNQVVAEVYVADDARQRDLDARYGVGVVRLTGYLEPA
ncbi:hypothetical protein SAMN05421684_6580 [Asanoa ishikariensis]|uniref:Uncharacterized protein n=1 Tax=Asanoa ishikariensis TaxID=137265 RepID=A0A1H3TXX5_9ACTN|nr:hypothetical protein SAMN05421684_6580 [Asanoa ishikariensis]